MRTAPIGVLLLTLLLLAPLGCKRGAPASKVALMDRIVEALQAGDEAAFERLLFDGTRLPELCPSLDAAEREELIARFAKKREQAREDFETCLALVDWSSAKRLLLNLGRRHNRVHASCRADWLEYESSELFLGVGERVYKVSVRRPVALDGEFGLQQHIRCFAKPPDQKPADALAIRRGCPHLRWNRIVQADCAELAGTP